MGIEGPILNCGSCLRTTKDVRHIGLKSAIANQILKKYGNGKARRTSHVNLTVPGQSVQFDKERRLARIPCLGLEIDCRYLSGFERIRQAEVGRTFVHLSVDVVEPEAKPPERFIGVDCNTTGHVAVLGIPHTGKVVKLGKTASHVHGKYKRIRGKLQKQGRLRRLGKIKNRESRIINDVNHKISKKIVDVAESERAGIRLENLHGIRKNKKQAKSFRYSLNSWSYYDLQKKIEYKARKRGVSVAYVAPAYTSQTCSRCGSLGDRNGKKFQCVCGHADHADINASFNIGKPVPHCSLALRAQCMASCTEKGIRARGALIPPYAAMPGMTATAEPTTL